MALVLVDSVFEQPIDPAGLDGLEGADAAPEGVSLSKRFVTRDATRCASVYEAPDLSSVEGMVRGAGLSPESVWEAVSFNRELGRPDPDIEGMVTVILQREFAHVTSVERLAQGLEHGAECFGMRKVTPVDSYVRLDGHVTMCIFAAPDAESVRDAVNTLGIPHVRAWTARS